MSGHYWVYILHCHNDTYYTGYTHDLNKRYTAHVNGTAKCKYTQSFKPIGLAQCWEVHADKAFAMGLERTIKKLSRADKEKLIADPMSLIQDPRVRVGAPQLMNEINHQHL